MKQISVPKAQSQSSARAPTTPCLSTSEGRTRHPDYPWITFFFFIYCAVFSRARTGCRAALSGSRLASIRPVHGTLNESPQVGEGKRDVIRIGVYILPGAKTRWFLPADLMESKAHCGRGSFPSGVSSSGVWSSGRLVRCFRQKLCGRESRLPCSGHAAFSGSAVG